MVAVAGGSLSQDQVASVCLHTFGTGDSDVAGVPAWVRAAAIAWAESHGNVSAVNPIPVGGGCKGSGSHHATGLFQIVPACHPDCDEDRLTEPLYNAQCAAKISRNGTSWAQWSTSSSARKYEAAMRGADTSAPAPPGGGALGILNKIPNPFDTAGDVAGALGNLGAFVTNRENWMRLLWVWLGAGLVTAGILIINRDTVTRAVVAGATGGTSEVAGAVGKVAA